MIISIFTIYNNGGLVINFGFSSFPLAIILPTLLTPLLPNN